MPQAMFERVKNGYSPEAVDQFVAAQAQANEQLKASLSTYETKLKEVTALALHLKQQNESERLRLAEVLMQANHTASGIVEQARQEAAKIIAEANTEAGCLKTVAAQEAQQLKKELTVLLHKWQQSTPGSTNAQVFAASPFKTPEAQREPWLDVMSELLKNVPPPEKASEVPHNQYEY